MTTLKRLPGGGLEIEMLTLETGEELGLLDSIQYGDQALLVLLTEQGLKALVEADTDTPDPLDLEVILAEEVGGHLVEITDPDVVALVQGLLLAADGDAEALEASAEYLDRETR